MKPLLNGKIYNYQVDEWKIYWESDREYRHWCIQKRNGIGDYILVVMFNPGSLNGDGKNLKRDTTLRILREVFRDTKYNPWIINLFDYSTTKPLELFNKWERKDNTGLVYDSLDEYTFRAVLYCYGDYENTGEYKEDIKKRITLVRSCFSNVPEITNLRNKSKTPKHPMTWQRQKLMLRVTELVNECYDYH